MDLDGHTQKNYLSDYLSIYLSQEMQIKCKAVKTSAGNLDGKAE